MLTALRPRVQHLLVVELDVADLVPGSRERLTSLVRRHERGLGEHAHDAGEAALVAQRFQLPVLTGQLTPDTVRTDGEHPATAWAGQVPSAGYRDVTVEHLAGCWSSPAFLLTARGDAAAGPG